MASIATVVTRGFGTFGSVNLLPTYGYGAGAAVAELPDVVFTFEPRRPIFAFDGRTPSFTYEPRRTVFSSE